MMLKKYKNSLGVIVATSLLLSFFVTLLLPIFVLDAQSTYVPLAPIPDTVLSGGGTNLSTYLTGLFKVGIAVSGVLAFLMIVWGGFTYLSTDAITGKEEGKERITRAIGGLILALAAFIILNTINPKLVELNLEFGKRADPGTDLARPSDLDAEAFGRFKAAQDARVAARAIDSASKEQTAYEMLYEAESNPDLSLEEVEYLTSQAQDLLGQASVSRTLENIASASNLGNNAVRDGNIRSAQPQLGAIKQLINAGYNDLLEKDPTKIDELEYNGAEKYFILAKQIGTVTADLGQADYANDIAKSMIANINSVNTQALARVTDPEVATQIDSKAKEAIAAIKAVCRTKNLPCRI